MAFFLCTAIPLAAQVKVGFSNVSRAGRGWESSVVGDLRKEYFENLADVRVLVDNFRLGMRLEISDPPERVVQFRGIRKLFAEYVDNHGLTLRAGSLYDLFGRGLTLNLFENRALGYDTGLEGVRAEYSSPWLNAKIVGGNIDYADVQALSLGVEKRETYKLRGAMAEIPVGGGASIGVSYLFAHSDLPSLLPNKKDEVRSQIPEVFARVHYEAVEIYACHVERYAEINGVDSARGGSMYGSISYVGDGYGITVEYKDYRLDLADPLQRVNTARLTRVLAFQNPPTLIREHSFSILTRYPHVVDFGDEVGFQTEVGWTPIEAISTELNVSMASRHFGYSFDPSTFAVSRTNATANLFPSLDKSFSPYWEIYGECEWRFNNEESLLKVGFARRSEVFYEVVVPEYSEERKLTGLVGQMQYPLGGEWGLRITGEHLWVSSTRGPILNRWFDLATGIEISYAPEVVVGMRYEETSWNETPGPRKSWVSGDLTARFGASNTLALSYGSERGGFVCANGICRVVNPFNGFRFTLTTRY